MSLHRIAKKISVAALAAIAVLWVPGAAHAQAGLVVNAKAFPTMDGAPLARTTVATFSDVAAGTSGAPACRAGTYAASVDWGDGTGVNQGQVTYRYGGEFGVCEYAVDATHQYAAPGSYKTVVEVSGPDGERQTAQGEITVFRISGEVVAQAVRVSAAAADGVVARFHDTDHNALASNLAATVQWGDGATTDAVVSGAAGEFAVSATHSYATEGSHPVTVTLTQYGRTVAVAGGSITVRGETSDAPIGALAPHAPAPQRRSHSPRRAHRRLKGGHARRRHAA